MRLIWAEKCGQPPTWTPAKSLVVCSKHFQPDDYQRDLKNELLNLPPRKLLKDSVPSLELGNVTTNNELPFTFPELHSNIDCNDLIIETTTI